nr:Os06g0324601 [Ipomoea batatas]
MQTPPNITSDAVVIPIPLGYPFSFLLWEAQKKPIDPIIAPSFPAAPDMPWHVVLNRAGNSSAGTMKVVVFGPKLEKKKPPGKRFLWLCPSSVGIYGIGRGCCCRTRRLVGTMRGNKLGDDDHSQSSSPTGLSETSSNTFSMSFAACTSFFATKAVYLWAKSADIGVWRLSFERLAARIKTAQTAIVTVELTRIPKPCMEKTAAMKAPRVFLLANSDMMVAERG